MKDWPSPEQITKTFGKEVPGFLSFAASAGWKVIFNNTGTSITLVPYDNSDHRIHISARNKGRSIKRFYKMIAKHSDPQRIAALDDIWNRKDLPQEAKDLLIDFHGIASVADSFEAMEDEAPPPPKPKKATAVEEAEAKVAQQVKRERHIVSERPHLMHKRLGKSYPSKTTIERRWSDGVIDYACAVPTCDKTSDSHLSFRGAHWAMHVRNGEAEPFDEKEAAATVVDDPSYTEHAWTRKAAARQSRVDAITSLLKGIDLKKITPEELAEQIVEFLGDSVGGGGGLGAPLTDAEVIDRIRTLVDRGTYADQEKAIRDRDQQIEDLMSYAEQRERELEERALLAEQEATKAKAQWDALVEIINNRE